jgi:hypothetical protein
MASPKLTVGDTYPPIRGAATDEKGLLALAAADELVFVAVSGKDVIEGEAEAIDPPEGVGDPSSALGFNWRYKLAAGDTAAAGSYAPWLKVVLDAGSTPPEIFWVNGGDQIVIQAAPE